MEHVLATRSSSPQLGGGGSSSVRTDSYEIDVEGQVRRKRDVVSWTSTSAVAVVSRPSAVNFRPEDAAARGTTAASIIITNISSSSSGTSSNSSNGEETSDIVGRHCADPSLICHDIPATNNTSGIVYNIITHLRVARWRSGRALDLRSAGRGFDSPPLRYRVHPWASCSHTCASVAEQF